MSTWLVVDADSMSWRAMFSRRNVKFEGQPTGVILGFLQEIKTLEAKFHTQNFAFCFDSDKSIRQEMFPAYKEKRKRRFEMQGEMAQRHRQDAKECKDQMHRLRTEILPYLGYSNCFMQEGYEADDLVASVCLNKKEAHQIVVISPDYDLLQLLSEDVSQYSLATKTVWTDEMFRSMYRIAPPEWAYVKALAGCITDSIPGVAGVGENKASLYIQNKLDPKSLIARKIEEFKRTEQWLLNLKLVFLPLDGTDVFRVKPDKLAGDDAWESVARQFGFKEDFTFAGMRR